MPIFWSQGTGDRLITYEIGQCSVQYLQDDLGISKAKEGGVGLEFHVYNGVEHILAVETLEDFGRWLQRVVPSEYTSSEHKGGSVLSCITQMFK